MVDERRLMEELEQDEGRVNEIYLDHLGYATFGIGHLVREDDPEYGLPVGTPVSEERVEQAFMEDLNQTIDEIYKLYDDFDYLPESVQHVLLNMLFNLGLPRLSNFANMKRAIDERDWQRAAIEMMDSRWYNQVPNRAGRLVAIMENVDYEA